MINKKKICILVLDVDGTLTDGKIYMGPNGEEFKAFNIKDGCGLHDILPRFGIEAAVITGRTSKIVENRCRELDIKMVYQGVKDKLMALEEIRQTVSKSKGVELGYDCIAYMGDDIIDIPCMKKCRISAAPSDACKAVKKIVDYVSPFEGGHGAARDFIEWLTELKENEMEEP